MSIVTHNNNCIPLVSVNLVTHNRCSLIDRCVKSILMQSYSHYEVVIVDDGSTDSTWDVLQEIAFSDNRIRIVKLNTTMGSAYARNCAFINSNGAYIAFMDDDDVWIDKNKLSKQVNRYESLNRVVGSSCQFLIASGTVSVDGSNRIVRQGVLPIGYERLLLMGNGFVFCPTVLTSRELMKVSGGFDENLMRGDDADFYRRCVFWHGAKVVLLPDVTTEIYSDSSARQSAPSDVYSYIYHLDFAMRTLDKFSNELKHDIEALTYWYDTISVHASRVYMHSNSFKYFVMSYHYAVLAFFRKPTFHRIVFNIRIMCAMVIFLCSTCFKTICTRKANAQYE